MRGRKNPKIEKAKNSKIAFKILVKHIFPYKFQLIIAFILVIISGVLSLTYPFFISLAIDKYIDNGGDIPGLKNLLIILFIIAFIQYITRFLQSYKMVIISQNILKDIREKIFSKVQYLLFNILEKMKKGDILSRINNDVENINNFLSNGFSELASNIIFVFGTIVAMIILNWKLALISIATIPLILITTYIIAKWTRNAYRANQKIAGEISGFLEENLTGIKTLKSFGNEKETIESFKKINIRARKIEFKSELASLILPPTLHSLGSISLGILIIAGSFLILNNHATIGALAGIIAYSRRFFMPFRAIAGLYNLLQSSLAGVERIGEILISDIEKDIIEAEDIKDVKTNLEFIKVDFAYKKNKKVIENINFSIHSNTSIAIVGPTGAGKTTIVKLISRYYDPLHGKILINNKDILSIKRKSFRNSLSVVLQEPFLFNRSIEENIKYAKPDASFEEVKKAAEISNADRFIEKLPEKYKTVISEDSSNISSGQKQLLSIARAILSNREILILDEATSNVDTRTEQSIQKALAHLKNNYTSIIIAHRLSTIKSCDLIIVIDFGKIVEEGTHKELMRKKGYYYKMYQAGI